MDQYFNQMEKIIKEKKTSSRIRFMLQDVIDLRRVRRMACCCLGAVLCLLGLMELLACVLCVPAVHASLGGEMWVCKLWPAQETPC